MELSWSSQFPISADGGVEATKVRESGGKGEPIEHLGDTGPGLVSLALVTPVACSQGVLETICDGTCLDRQLQVEVLKFDRWINNDS